MAKFLIDVNLPYYFSIWNNSDCCHMLDINETWTDEKIWEYAKKNQFIIVTKDADFSIKALTLGTPPKVIHIKTGNMKMKEFYEYLNRIWIDILVQIKDNNIINVYNNRLELIN